MVLTKSGEIAVFPIASVASNTVTPGSAIDVSTYYEGHLTIRLGRGTGSAFTTGPIVRVEGSYSASPTANDWTELVPGGCGPMALGTSLASQAVSGTEAIGQTTVTLAAGTGFAAPDYVFFHNSTIGNSEWSRMISGGGGSADIVIEEGLVFAQTGSTARDQAEKYQVALDLTPFNRLRIVVDGRDSGQAVICEAVMGAVSGL